MNSLRKTIAILALITTGVVAQEDIVQIHGAISQSFIYSKNNHYVFEGSKGGSLDFSEAYINFSKQFGSELRVGMQISSRNFGNQDDFSPKLDWAYGDYRAMEYLGIRIGKVKLPFGIYNETRDVDFAKPNILLDQGIYPESFRLLLNSYTGASLYGNINLNAIHLGDLEYELFGGTTSVSETYPSTQYTRFLFNSPSTTQKDILISGLNTRYLPLDFLKFGYTFVHASGYSNIASENIGLNLQSENEIFNFEVAPIEKALKFSLNIHVLSAEVQCNNFTLVGEFELSAISSINSDNFINAMDDGLRNNLSTNEDAFQALIPQAREMLEAEGHTPSEIDAIIATDYFKILTIDTTAKLFVEEFSEKVLLEKYAWYSHLFYQWTDDLGVYAGFGYTSQKNSSSNDVSQYDQNTRSDYQKDYSTGVNYYITDNFLVKGEYHYIDGNYGSYNPVGEAFINDGNLWIARASYSF